jgi:hypothetical protein
MVCVIDNGNSTSSNLLLSLFLLPDQVMQLLIKKIGFGAILIWPNSQIRLFGKKD